MIVKSTAAPAPRTQSHDINSTASARWLSGKGVLPALLLIPLLLGLMACLPVPVGDPEKSRVDPAVSGVWRITGDEDEQMLMVLDPYDKRTWLMTLIGLDVVDGNNAGTQSATQAPFNAANATGFDVKGLAVYKCWLTRIKGETFITWEPKTLSDTLPNLTPKQWWVFRLRKDGDDTLYLDSFDYTIDGLDKVRTRREAEKIIARHVDDPDFFEEDKASRLERLPQDGIAALPALLEKFGYTENF